MLKNDKNSITTSIDAEKEVDKMQHTFLIKSHAHTLHNRLGLQGSGHNLIEHCMKTPYFFLHT